MTTAAVLTASCFVGDPFGRAGIHSATSFISITSCYAHSFRDERRAGLCSSLQPVRSNRVTSRHTLVPLPSLHVLGNRPSDVYNHRHAVSIVSRREPQPWLVWHGADERDEVDGVAHNACPRAVQPLAWSFTAPSFIPVLAVRCDPWLSACL